MTKNIINIRRKRWINVKLLTSPRKEGEKDTKVADSVSQKTG
jgi:hypothetical protein